MSAPAITPDSTYNRPVVVQPGFVDIAVNSAFSAGVCAIAAHTLTMFPLAAVGVASSAVFGGVSSVIRQALSNNLADGRDTYLQTVLKTCFVYGTAAALGTFFTNLLGYTMVFKAALQLSAVLLITTKAVQTVFTTRIG